MNETSEVVARGPQSVQVRQFIEVRFLRSERGDDATVREVVQIWELDGRYLAESDLWQEEWRRDELAQARAETERQRRRGDSLSEEVVHRRRVADGLGDALSALGSRVEGINRRLVASSTKAARAKLGAELASVARVASLALRFPGAPAAATEEAEGGVGVTVAPGMLTRIFRAFTGQSDALRAARDQVEYLHAMLVRTQGRTLRRDEVDAMRVRLGDTRDQLQGAIAKHGWPAAQPLP